MELGSRIQEIREDQHLTQTELAARVRTSQSTISQIEAGDRNPSYRMLVKLAAALGVTVGYVLGEDTVGDLDPAEEAHFRQYRGLTMMLAGSLVSTRDSCESAKQTSNETRNRESGRTPVCPPFPSGTRADRNPPMRPRGTGGRRWD